MNVNPADKGKDSKSIESLSQRKSFGTQREDNKDSHWITNKEDCEKAGGQWDYDRAKCIIPVG
ncbi:MAG: hypothetical protein SWZ49_11420 [Cyanobacteriota bacterium]|nr:hypothetical protein [Cyanobacteriota bacterium]